MMCHPHFGVFFIHFLSICQLLFLVSISINVTLAPFQYPILPALIHTQRLLPGMEGIELVVPLSSLHNYSCLISIHFPFIIQRFIVRTKSLKSVSPDPSFTVNFAYISFIPHSSRSFSFPISTDPEPIQPYLPFTTIPA